MDSLLSQEPGQASEYYLRPSNRAL